MGFKRWGFLFQNCKRPNLCLRTHSPILNFSASSKLPSQLLPPNPPPVPTTTLRSVTNQQFAPSQTLPPTSPPSANKEGATNYEYNPENLWNNVVVLKCDSSSESGSCDVHLVGTCHVSTDSCKEVQAIIKHIKPQVVFLELCSGRFKLCIEDIAQAQKVPTMQQIMISMLKKKKVNTFGIVLSYFYTMVGKKLNVLPGAEFRAAYEEARSYGARIVLGDRPVHITFQRISRNISLWHWTKCAYYIFFQSDFKTNSKVVTEKLEAVNDAESLRKVVEEMNDPDMVKFMLQNLRKVIPALAETLIDERDMYMAASLLEVSKKHSSVVAVVGKAHLEGIVKYWKRPIDTTRLMEIPTKSVGIFRYSASIATGLALGTGLYFICMRLH